MLLCSIAMEQSLEEEGETENAEYIYPMPCVDRKFNRVLTTLFLFLLNSYFCGTHFSSTSHIVVKLNSVFSAH